MHKRVPDESDHEALPEPVAARLLARAAELDAARAAGSAVADLRAAAGEAGISAPAFDAALAELRGGGQGRGGDAKGRSRPRVRRWVLAAVGAVLLAGALAVSRQPSGADAAPGVPMIEEAILLRCLPAGEAAELIRPLLRYESNAVVVRPTQAPRVLTVRATPAQMQQVKAVLEKYESTESPACTPRPTGTTVP